MLLIVIGILILGMGLPAIFRGPRFRMFGGLFGPHFWGPHGPGMRDPGGPGMRGPGGPGMGGHGGPRR